MLRKVKQKNLIKSAVIILFMLPPLFSCSRERGIRIAVAANFSAAAEELKRAYEALYPGRKVEVIAGSSGKLAMQIMHGAPYDIFFSADMDLPEILSEEGFALGKPLLYAYGRLILLSAKKGNGMLTLKRTTGKTGEKIIMPNPELAPYGKASREVLEITGIYEKIKPGLVIAENVVQAARYALLGKGTCFTALSLLTAPAFRDRKSEIEWIEIDKKLYTEIQQGAVIISKSKKLESARLFYNFVLNSEKAEMIIKRYGYAPAKKRRRKKRSKI